RPSIETFALNGYARIPSMPMTRLSLNYENWDDYFRSLSKATRKDLRRKFRKAERASKIEMQPASDIAPFIDEIYPLYLAVHERAPLKFETLTKDYFLAIAQRMPERARFFVWRQSGKIVAFSFCLICGDAIYDECIGLDTSRPCFAAISQRRSALRRRCSHGAMSPCWWNKSDSASTERGGYSENQSHLRRGRS